MNPYPKPFLSVADQIALIRSRGMAITDDAKARHYLEQIGYYRLSGYWYPLRQSRIEQIPSGSLHTTILDDFRSGAEFCQVVDLYVFDKRMRLLMLDVLERIEIAIRTDLALCLGGNSPWAYREPAHLDGKFTTEISAKQIANSFCRFYQPNSTAWSPS